MDIIDRIFETTTKIAVIGLSPDEHKASFLVAQFLQENGFQIFPVYPKCEEILGEKVYRNLDEISEQVDTVVLFRKSEFAKEALEQIKRKKIKNFWLQLGISNDEVAKECEFLGINFVQDKCMQRELPLYKQRKKLC
ncbi:CoA-binding protein [Campylobacter sp. MIT 21-1685]|uniref:CoA-binding protein n=1 Tax=unclassified Campylobacter TaxID=2593542 RepID=UPI00224B1140|nr:MULTISPECIES: CoA-binding protein [unclassified Campylobacter]MCX2682770.1 CoA-binding protein [Campylobacter sp. MIT 21-1684]MCX2751084.1 CoA-binding protein [Campylobacter sp. MIT 21-1682]MCX2807251.1 CoA-binding protein [Campylobacter sp. MIT 21-1685]